MADWFNDPNTLGLLAAGAGLLEASGPSRTPVSFGQALGRGGMAGLGAMQQAKNAALQQQVLGLHGALYGAQAGKLKEETARLARLQGILSGQPETAQAELKGIPEAAAMRINAPWAATSQIPQPTASPLDVFKGKASSLAQNGFLTEANQMADFVKKMNPDLEFKDGVWYDKSSGAPVRGGAGINQQGFGYQTNIGQNGQISVGMLPGAADLFRAQQGIGEQVRAQNDLVTVPATGPNQPPTFQSRANLLPGAQGVAPVAAGMTPNVAAGAAADAAQQMKVSENYATQYNNLQNSAMTNPAKIAKFQQIGSLLGDFEGGKFSQSGLELAKAFNSAGLKVDPRLPNKEAATAMANEMALELRSPAGGAGMPGAMSDQDREFLKSMVPQMSQTAEGRKSIIDSRVKVMERENTVAGMARQYRQRYGKLDENFFSQLQDWSGRNHLFSK